jgi:hypothetical protein
MNVHIERAYKLQLHGFVSASSREIELASHRIHRAFIVQFINEIACEIIGLAGEVVAYRQVKKINEIKGWS